MCDVSEEALLEYFHSAGGIAARVQNADMLRTFKPFIGHADGEKYLVLKKKYRQMLQERHAKHAGSDGDGQRRPRAPAAAQWDATDASACPPQRREQRGEPRSCGRPDGAAEVNLKPACCSVPGASQQQHGLDPMEKEWIYSAAAARVPDLSQLLRQDPSLANKKVTALHWAAKHGSGDMAALVANAGADVNNKSGYTPLHIAALHGHQHIVDLLIGTYGAKANLRDYSGHLACHYLKIKEPESPEDDAFPVAQVTSARERNRNRKLASLFHSKKKWGSAEELAPIEEERTASHQLALPAFRPRKFSR
uniref:Uncharacterized protein n=1 Tax=Mola mola TaxID=94237 RepID=A0A3Q3XBG9_MOLML